VQFVESPIQCAILKVAKSPCRVCPTRFRRWEVVRFAHAAVCPGRGGCLGVFVDKHVARHADVNVHASAIAVRINSVDLPRS
jgi:hypothetical protein